MKNPFTIEGRTQISFSGGRSSAYMLYKILEAHGGKLPEDSVVTFANTGKEREETLDFVNECSVRWNVHIRWIEYLCTDKTRERFIERDYRRASRNGEPFASLIEKRNYLPNPVARFCTSDLKIRPMEYFIENLWGKNIEYDRVIGLRADEKRRVARFSNKDHYKFPLSDAGIYKKDVYDFWQKNNFDLRLDNNNGVTPHGNCDLCFLKGTGKLISLINENPEKAIWWMNQEEKIGATFRKNTPSYARMIQITLENPMIDFSEDNDLIDCACTD